MTTSSTTQHLVQESHAHEDAIVGLAEIRGPRIVVDVDRDFVDARQGVEQDRVRVEPSHCLHADDVLPLRRFVVLSCGEAFLLHPRLIDDVDDW